MAQKAEGGREKKKVSVCGYALTWNMQQHLGGGESQLFILLPKETHKENTTGVPRASLAQLASKQASHDLKPPPPPRAQKMRVSSERERRERTSKSVWEEKENK